MAVVVVGGEGGDIVAVVVVEIVHSLNGLDGECGDKRMNAFSAKIILLNC